MCLSRMFVGDQLIMLATSYWQHVMIIMDGGSLCNLIAEKKSVDTLYLGSTFSLPSFLRLGQCLTLAALPLVKSLVDVRQCFDPWGGSAWKTGGWEGEQYEGEEKHSPTKSNPCLPPLTIILPISSNAVTLATKTTQKLLTSPCPCTVGTLDWCWSTCSPQICALAWAFFFLRFWAINF